MKILFVIIMLILVLVAIGLHINFRKFLKRHAEEEVEQHESTLLKYTIGIVVVEVLMAFFCIIQICLR